MTISVSITTFNHERFIRQAVENVLAQQCRHRVEVVVGDDCSTDGTPDILADMEREHRGRLKVIRPAVNLGHNGRAMFLETLRHCHGDFVGMLDGDDYWTSDHKLEQQLDFFARHPDCALCHHAVESVYEDGHTELWKGNFGDEERVDSFEVLLPWHYIGSPAPLVRQQVMRSLPDWVNRSPFGDWPIYLAAADAGRIGYLPQTMAAYRFHTAGVWTQASAAERQQQVVDFFATIDGPIMRRNAWPLLQALTFHLLELAARRREEGSLPNVPGDLPHVHPAKLYFGRHADQVTSSPTIVNDALLVLHQVGPELGSGNQRCVTRAQSALHLLLAKHWMDAGVEAEAARAALRALRADPRSFLFLVAATLSNRASHRPADRRERKTT